MSDNYFVNLYNAFIGKSYAKQIEKPKEENRGASWNSAGGVRNTFSAQVSMDAFGVHGYTHAGVKRLSQDLAALPLKLVKGYGSKAVELMDHPVLDLLRQPTTDIDEFLFREQITIDITLSGNCYILLLGGDKPISMVRLHPEEVRIVTDPKQGLIGYEHNSSGSVVMYPPNRIIHGKNAGYQKGPQALYGTGAIQPLARELDADLNSQKLVSEATQKGRPDVLLSPKEDGDIWNKEVRRQILDQYAGMQKAGGALVLSGQVQVDMLQLSPRDMEYQAARTHARESISAVLGVPPTVLGIPSANYATARQAAVEYWSNQIKRGKRIALLFTRIARLWESDLHFEHDYSEVEALQSVRNDKLMRIEKHIFVGAVPPEIAYAYEGMDYPRAEKEAQDIGEEEDENVRIMRFIDNIKEINYGDKSNAKEAMDSLPEGTQNALKRKAKEHNEEHGKDKKRKLTNRNYLAVVYYRGIGAFENNPQSVRPNISSPQQWAMARVNSFLYALRNQRYRSGKHDTDLLPTDHPMSGAEKAYYDDLILDIQEIKLFTSEYLDIEVVNVPSNPQVQEEQEILKSILGSPPNWNDYKQSHLFFNSNQDQMKEGYYIRIGRRLDTDDILNAAPEKGKVAIFKDLLDLAVDHLNGRFGRPPITEEERRSAYEIISKYFEKLQMDAPVLLDSYLTFDAKKKDEEITNFPKRGDDKKISLRNSQYRTFDINYAQKLKENYPTIWRAGGNIRGNDQYRKLLPIAKNNGVPKGLSEERAIKLREAWIARHIKDGSQFSDPDQEINLSTIGGIVAQIKWLAIGSIGMSKMKKVINAMKRKINAEKKQIKMLEIEEQKRVKQWNTWIKTYQKPTENELKKATKEYFDGAIKRYANRIKKAKITKSNDSLVDPSSIEAKDEERKIFEKIVGKIWIQRWLFTAQKEGANVFSKVGRKPPSDFIFGNRDYAAQVYKKSSKLITSNTSKKVLQILESGLLAGLSRNEIATKLEQDDQSGIFSLSRATRIAQTESTRIVNGASLEAYKEAQSLGIQTKKQWLSARDGKVRPSHKSLDYKVVGLQENFKLGSEYGGLETSSPSNFGVAREDVNCRCVVLPVVEVNDEGPVIPTQLD